MNTLRYTQRLEEAGFNRRQAEEIVTIQQDSMNDTFATKHDLENVRNEMRSEFKAVRMEITNAMLSQTIKLGAMQVVSVGVILAAFQYLR